MKILIRGAGDLATGIASRLYGAGHKIIMTERDIPLTVRRTVALSRAVYEGCAKVEQMEACLAKSQEQAEEILSKGDIPVLVDEEAQCRQWFRPDVLVDAILAKRNVGTRITDAPFVIGVGPGFTAGEDCNCVVETKRGHTMAQIIWEGSAIPNTGIPGEVGGYTTERLLRAAADGRMEPCVSIGDSVKKGQAVAVTGGVPVYAQMSGIVRGMLQDGVQVQKGLKIGDIDARAMRTHCESISDKARGIGGGVLEAAELFGRMRGRYAIVLLAAGESTRFGEDKLFAVMDGEPMYGRMLRKVTALGGFPAYIVTGSEIIGSAAQACGVRPVYNSRPKEGISRSLILGMEAAVRDYPRLSGILFSVCDQPYLRVSSMQRVLQTAFWHPGSVVRIGAGGREGNPVLWDKKYFHELASLSGDEGGRQIIGKHRDSVRIVNVSGKELKDIDRKEDLPDNLGFTRTV